MSHPRDVSAVIWREGFKIAGWLLLAATVGAACVVLAIHPVLAWVAIGGTGLVAGMGVIASLGAVSSALAFRRRGYRAWFGARDKFLYEEVDGKGLMRGILFPFKYVFVGRSRMQALEVALPNDFTWDGCVPAWARGRRAEVMARIVEAFGGGTKVIFVDAAQLRDGAVVASFGQ